MKSIEQEQNTETGVSTEERREFIRQAATMFGLTVCGASLSSLVSSCESDEVKDPVSSGTPIEFDLAETPSLANVGGAAHRTFGANNGGQPVIIVRISDAEFTAFTAVCTHEGCLVEPALDASNRIICQCHLSFYRPEDGTVIAGPAPTALQRYPAVFDDAANTLTITF